jgi:hypothetical protein
MNIVLARVGWKLLVTALLFGPFWWSGVTYSQNAVSAARRFDSFNDLRTSDLKAHLDLYAEALLKEPNLRAFIVCYRREGWMPGSFLRYIHGYSDYLINSRGVLPERVSVIDGGIAENELTELWLAPMGSDLPNRSTTVPSTAGVPLKFDSIRVGSGCVGEYTLELQEPEDSVRFFAQALHSSPMKGFIVVHRSTWGTLAEARKLAESSKRTLTQQHGIAADRVVTRLSSSRSCLEMNSWLLPAGFIVPPISNPEVLFQSRLLDEAEQKQFTVRRVEFAGNQWTRDRLLRQRIPGLQEGEIFTKEILRQNLNFLSRLKIIRPVGLDDVDVRLISKDKLIDLVIFVKERRRPN